MYRTVSTVDERFGTFTQATSLPVAPSKDSISWLSRVTPSEEGKTMSKASSRASAARAGRDGRGQRGRVGSVKIVGDRSEGTKVGVEQDGVAAGGQVIPKAVFELDGDGGGRDA